jgi:hypothetical protein
MKFFVWKMGDDWWRFSNLKNIAGDTDSFATAFDEAFALASVEAVAAA